MLLELRFQGGLDLLDVAHGLLDFAAVAAVQKRHARAGTGGVADAGDVVERAVRDQPEDHRVFRIDVAAESAGKADPVEPVGAELVLQQLDARIERALGELDRADIVLRDRYAVFAVVNEVRECTTVRLNAGRARRECPVNRAVGPEDSGEQHFAQHFDDTGAAYPGNPDLFNLGIKAGFT